MSRMGWLTSRVVLCEQLKNRSQVLRFFLVRAFCFAVGPPLPPIPFFVIPAKAGIHRASWIVARLVCSLGYRLDPRLREDDVCRGKDDEGVGGFTLLVGASAWARGGWLAFRGGAAAPAGSRYRYGGVHFCVISASMDTTVSI